MKIYTTMVILDGEIHRTDTIAYQNGFWLVPDWLVSPDKKHMRPLRIISLATIPHEGNPEGPSPQFVISYSIPKSLFRGMIPKGEEKRYVIVENPQIIFPNPDVLN
jgi:hypothetical protein